MEIYGLIIEDGFVIVGRAGQRVPLPDGTTQQPEFPQIGAVAEVRRPDGETGPEQPRRLPFARGVAPWTGSVAFSER